MKVSILGCGPAGLMAAHAAELRGAEVTIFSKKRKSEMFGCQYLHRPIPEISTGNGTWVEYTLRGTPADYRRKVYGTNWNGTVSGEDLEESHAAWDIRQAYDLLWLRYQSRIAHHDINASWMVGFSAEGHEPGDLILSTIPAPLLCMKPDEHGFFSERVWAIGDAPERGIFAPSITHESEIICNAFPEPGWYRAANVFGYHTVEWPWRDGKRPPIEGVSEVVKPLRTTCNCWPNVVRLGRYGQWKKGVLSHEAFYETDSLLADQAARLF